MAYIDNLLEIESTSELFNYKVFDGSLHLWPLIRCEILYSGLYESLGVVEPFVPFKIKYSRALPYLCKTLKYRSSRIGKSDVIFFGSNVSNIKTPNGYFNRLSELFAGQFLPVPAVIEESSNFDYKRPRTYQKVYTNDDIVLRAKILSKFIRISRQDLKTIDDFIDYLRSNFSYSFNDKSKWDRLKRILQRLCKEFNCRYTLYQNLFKKTRSKIIFVEGASYGYAYIPLILAAKDLGIKVLEYQHGLISPNHPAYNFHSQLPEEYLRYMPDYYLTYGKYWKDNCRMPIEVIVIGNPYLSKVSISRNSALKKNQVLYASGAVDPVLTVERALYLQSILAPFGYKIVFRPHPSEIERLNNVYKPIVDAEIGIDHNNLYDTLNESRFVFGDFSTVLFEALAFDCMPLVMRSAGSDLHIMSSEIKILNSVDDVTKFVQNAHREESDIENIWSDNWESNFKSFLSEKCNLNLS